MEPAGVPLVFLPVLGSLRRLDAACGIHEFVHSRPLSALVHVTAKFMAGWAALAATWLAVMTVGAVALAAVQPRVLSHWPEVLWMSALLILPSYAFFTGLALVLDAFTGRTGTVLAVGSVVVIGSSLFPWDLRVQTVLGGRLRPPGGGGRRDPAVLPVARDRCEEVTAVLRSHLRTLFGPWHLVALVAVLAAALLSPTGTAGHRALLGWFVVRAEIFGPLLLMGLTASVILVDGRVDERWGTSPRGLRSLFLQRWALAAAYYALVIGLFIWGAGPRAGDVGEARTFLSTLVSGALFSAACHLFHSLSGSATIGWSGGLAVYFVTMAVATIWCPYDSVYQLWLPFAGLSDAAPSALALSKGAYTLVAILLLWVSGRLLAVPERVIRANE